MVVNQRDKVDWVMVELTGVADPGEHARLNLPLVITPGSNSMMYLKTLTVAGPIAKSFWENEEMGDLVLDGIVCVVDSKNFTRVCRHVSRAKSLRVSQQIDHSQPGQINEAQR